MRKGVLLGTALTFTACWAATTEPILTAENDHYALSVDEATGAIVGLVLKDLDCDLIGEKRLAANFRINVPLPDYLCNYIDGMAQQPLSVTAAEMTVSAVFSGMHSEQRQFPIDLRYTITLDGDSVRFRAQLTNRSEYPVAEFWFPRLGGWTDFGTGRDALLATPDYIGCSHRRSLFRGFPGARGLGAEAAEFAMHYPGLVMPWWDLYDADTDRGLYLAYHDETFRFSTWHTYLYPNAAGRPGDAWLTAAEAAGAPVGLVFSHVRYPYIRNGETLDSGEFLLRLHSGDWRQGSKYYRAWFMEHFPFDKSSSWLRKQSAWFTSIIYQPEDRVVADYETYDRWCADAQARGINCFELIGWDKGGLERDYPEYVPEEKLGGHEGFRKLLKNIDARGGKCLVFANYNILDCNTDWYKRELRPYTHQDTFGNTPNWMGWGESTLTARLGLSVRRHVLGSAAPPLQSILEKMLTDVVRDGAHGLQLDKVVVGSALDFNPLNTEKPDTALCEGLVQGIAQIYKKCKEIDPEFCLASEACQDRLIPYADVYYRNVGGFEIAPLRYVFPEWTACQHVSAPYDFNGVNGAVLTGAVICVEPDSYQNTLADPQYKALGEYIQEVERIRKELADYIFLGAYYDTLDGRVQTVTANTGEGLPKYSPDPGGGLPYRVHGHRETDQRALVVANPSLQERLYFWEFLKGKVREAALYEPFQPVRTVSSDTPLAIQGQGVQILIEHRAPAPPGLRLSMRCGVKPGEVVYAAEGYSAVVKQGFMSAWGPYWLPPVYHCRAHEQELQIEIATPPNAEGTLRLYVIDPDRYCGGRRQEVFVEDQSLGVIENFIEGRWLECPVKKPATADGKVMIRAVNQKPDSNVVISLIEWMD